MRSVTTRLVLFLFLMSAALAPQAALAEIPFVKEDLKVTMPYGEAVFGFWHNTRTPNEYYLPFVYFSDASGISESDIRAAEQLAAKSAWVVLIDLKDLQARLASEERFATALNPLAESVKGKMSEAMGPRLKGMPERIWPMTFGGRGAGAVRAIAAGIKYESYGGVKGIMLFSPAAEAPALGEGEAPLVLRDLLPKLGVTLVSIIAPAEDEKLRAISKEIIGHNSVSNTPAEGISFISSYYSIRHRRAPKGKRPAPNPADLFRPGAVLPEELSGHDH